MADAGLTVAITGATGFVGRHVLRQVLAAGHQVRVLARLPRELPPDPNLTVVQGDLDNHEALTQLVVGAQAVIHIVGIIKELPAQGQTFEHVHVEGTANLLAAAKRGGSVRRWIHMSALGSRPNAVSQYHQTKWRAEEAVRNSEIEGLAWTIFRPSIIHGPDGEFMQMVKGFWCDLFPPFVPYFGAGLLGRGGAGRLQPVYIEDLARCFAAALTLPRSERETYPIGGPDVYTWPQLYATVKEHLSRAGVRARNKRIMPVPAWYAKLIAGLPGVPFNRDQVIMSQEDSTCQIGKVEEHFAIKLAAFELTLAQYADRIG
ncbi:MAG: NAD(P)H-binding protein [Phycisphaeraceae bacterium]